MKSAIAIVGLGCCYPDARSPIELWQNVLAGRRAFRRLPPERLRLADYYAPDESAEDRSCSTEAAVIEGYEFDRVRFRVAGSTFRTADLAHWLALDVAAQALDDAGFVAGAGLPVETTGVFLGNTLTGEFSRANTLRLRWPFVRRVAQAALSEQALAPEQQREFLAEFEAAYKQPFPPVGAETLAGGLSNTIAGRICNHFDLKGGGYTLDGACASSLLAVTNACAALFTGDLDVALAGGVDLSLDPFELIGFAKAGALAKDEMRVYDRRAAGFWPGEGCGFVVLMRLTDAQAQARRIYAVINGWGISSDGSGGITRPEVAGQMLALERAYRRAGYGIETVAYFEGHGTGTSVGDATELKALSEARRRADPNAPLAAISSVKANIGHTKAAAGVAGLLKAVMALHTQMLPPTVGCQEPHSELTGAQASLRVLRKGERWPQEQALRAGVSAMGFGGINTHITLEAPAGVRRRTISQRESALLSSAQDAELFLLSAPDREALRRQLAQLSSFAAKLSRAELTDLAVNLSQSLAAEADAGHQQAWRAAVVAATPAELAAQFQQLQRWLMDEGAHGLKCDIEAGVFLGAGSGAPRIGFLFPGQAAPVYLNGGAFARRFEPVAALYAQARLPATGDTQATALAQPAIVTASMAGLRVLNRLGIEAHVAVGHSLGELTALHWAGACDEETLLRLATARAQAMTAAGDTPGKMACIKAGPAEVEAILNGDPVVISNLNAPNQTVVAGAANAVDKLVAHARAAGHGVIYLNVSHAFHSPLMAGAVPLLARHLRAIKFQRLQSKVISTVTGQPLTDAADLNELLCRQVTAPVRFTEAATVAAAEVDLFIEVGPGHILGHLTAEFLDRPCISLDAGGESLRGLLKAVGGLFAAGASMDQSALFAGRFARPFKFDYQPRFFMNPCELAPVSEDETQLAVETRRHAAARNSIKDDAEPIAIAVEAPASRTSETVLELVRRLVAERAELPVGAVRDDHRLLGDLHLNSITVSQLVVEAARHLGLAPPVAPTEYAHATVAELAVALAELAADGVNCTPVERHPPGVEAWIRCFTVELVEQPLRVRSRLSGQGVWRVLAHDGHLLASALRAAFADCAGGGTVVCLPPDADERSVNLLLAGARAVAADEGATHFVLVEHGRGAAAFARTLQQELPHLKVCVLNVPLGHAQAVEWIMAEVAAADGYTEAHYDETGTRRVPVLRLLPPPVEPCDTPLGSEDLILVTGGGKGIAAECALWLARETGARLALLGRSKPADDAELSANLARFKEAGIRFGYFAADVTDPAAVLAAVAQAESELGCVTAVLHGAGVNTPRLLSALDEETCRRTLAPKMQGARNLLAAIRPERLRLFVTFGSIIARIGLRGEADYALANEWLTDLTKEWQTAHPHCRCLAIEWSVWSGTGMGQRLGRVEALTRQGITPIPTEEGIRLLRHLLAHRLSARAVVVTGRFGEPPTLKLDGPALPLLRFLEECKVYYPRVELITEASLSVETDPYLRDHIFQGAQLFPAVLGLEAMAQAAQALTGAHGPPSFTEVKFARPITVPPDAATTLRIVALVQPSGAVEVALRSEQTAFQLDHFRAMCHFDEPRSAAPDMGAASLTGAANLELPPIALEPARALYDGVLFHQGRFRRVRRYRRLSSTGCITEIERDGAVTWFGRYMPAALVLGDPGRRDATIHAIQACVPNNTILPVGVSRLKIAPGQTTEGCFVHARERAYDGRTFTYDVEVTGLDGSLWECWQGLRLQVVGGASFQGEWAGALLGAYLERRIRELGSAASVAVAIEQDATAPEPHLRSERAIERLLGPAVRLLHRVDGKPELTNGQHVSLSHALDLTFAVIADEPLACDVEEVAAHSATVWRDLLGRDRFALAETVARLTADDIAVAATRVWTASESLKKIGAAGDAPLTFASVTDDAWVLLASPPYHALSYQARMLGSEKKLIFTVLIRKPCESAGCEDAGL